MAGPTVTGGNVSTLVPSYYDRRLLENLYKETMLYNYCEHKPLPHNEGKSIYFSNLSTDAGALSLELTEGTAPTAGDFSAVQRYATIRQFGQTKTTSDLLEMTAITDVVNGAVDLMATVAADTLEIFLREATFRYIPATMTTVSAIPVISASMQCISAIHDDSLGLSGEGGTSPKTFSWTTGGFPKYMVSAVGTVALSNLATSANYSAYELNCADLRHATKILRRRNVKPYYNEGLYVAFVDAVAEEQLLNDPVWQTMANTEPRGLRKWEKGVVGDVHGVRVVRNNHMLSMADGDHLSGDNCYGHWTLVMGKGALACTELEPAPGRPGRRATGMTIIPRTKVDHTNPLGQYSTMGWKMSVASVVLNASAGLYIVSLAEGG